MDPATIIALIIGGTKVIQGLGQALATLNGGGTLTDDQMALIRAEQLAAQQRNDAAINNALGDNT